MLGSNQATGERYRWISEDGVSRTEDGYEMQGGRYAARGVTLYGNGEAVAVSYSSSTVSRTVYLGKDVMGSVRTATTDNVVLEDRYEYDAFGTPYSGDLSGMMNLGYTGKPYDTSTGLYNYGFRDYRPQAARFTTLDPIRDGNNWFSYVNNDPVNYVDLWGLAASDKIALVNGLNIIVSKTEGTLSAIYYSDVENSFPKFPGSIVTSTSTTITFSVITNVVSGNPDNSKKSDDNRVQTSGDLITRPTQLANGTYNIAAAVSPSEKVNPSPQYIYGRPGNGLSINAVQMLEDINTGKLVPDSGYMIHITPNKNTNGCFGIYYNSDITRERYDAEMRMQWLVILHKFAKSQGGSSIITVKN